MLWRRPDTATQGLAAFLRVSYTPPDRNLISLEIDAGFTFKGLFPGRELDVLGIGTSYARIGYARRLDQDEILFTSIERPVRDYEAVLEITYEARLAPWWLLQPDLQLVFHPGGYIAAPLQPQWGNRSPMLWSSVFDPVSPFKVLAGRQRAMTAPDHVTLLRQSQTCHQSPVASFLGPLRAAWSWLKQTT
jgi:hypothetical protein